MSTIPVLEREIDSKISRLKELNKREEFTDGEQTEITNIRKELTDKQNQLEQRRYLASLEAESIKPDEPDLAQAKKDFSVRKAILGQMVGNKVDDGLEREVSANFAREANEPTEGIWCPIETRAVTTTTPSGGAGSHLVADMHQSQIIPLLRPSLIASQLPFTRLSAKGNLSIPRQKAGVKGKFLGETASLANEDSEYETVTASPKRVGALASFSVQMMLQSDPSIEGLVVNDINERLQRVVDKVILYGQNDSVTAGDTTTGFGSGAFTLAQWEGEVGAVADQFEGITHDISATTPTGTTLNNGKAIDVKDIEKLQSELDSTDLSADRYFICSPQLYRRLATTLEFSSSSSEVIGRGMRVRDYPTVLSTAVVSNRTKGTASTLADLILVHPASYAIVTWQAVQVLVNPYADADYKAGRISVRAMAYMSSYKRYADLARWYNQCVTII